MEIRNEKAGAAVVAILAGRLDESSASNADASLAAILDGGERHLILDLAALEYISSVGLRVILTSAKKLRAAKGTLRICGAVKHVREVIELSGFTSIIPMHATREEAVGAAPGSDAAPPSTRRSEPGGAVS